MWLRCSYILMRGLLYKLLGLCRILGLKPSPAVFLHHYSTRPKEPVGWLSLFGQPRIGLLAPYSSSFKNYKNTFFRVVINHVGRSYFFDGDTPKFPFYWTRNPLHYDEWPRTMMSAEDCEVLNLLDSLPRRLPTKRIVAILSSPRPRRDMLGMCEFFIHTLCVNLSYFVFVCTSFDGVA